MRHAQVKIDRTARRGARPPTRAAGARALSRPQRRSRAFDDIASIGFAYLAALLDGVAILSAASASSALYRFVTLGRMPPVESATSVGVIVGVIVIAAGVQRGEYGLRGLRLARRPILPQLLGVEFRLSLRAGARLRDANLQRFLARRRRRVLCRRLSRVVRGPPRPRRDRRAVATGRTDPAAARRRRRLRGRAVAARVPLRSNRRSDGNRGDDRAARQSGLSDRRSRARRRRRADAPPGRHLYRGSLVAHARDRGLRRRLPAHAGRNPSRRGSHSRTLPGSAHRPIRPHRRSSA